MLKILEYGKLNKTYCIQPGDTINLIIHDKVVHSADIHSIYDSNEVNTYALALIGGYPSYILGNDSLYQKLIDLGFIDEG